MCWSAEASLALGVAGAATATYTAVKTKRKGLSIAIFYFSLMEFIQYFSYASVGQCSVMPNQAFTYLSYAHIALQPIFFNLIYFDTMGAQVKRRTKQYVYAICGVVALLFIVKVLPLVPTAPLCEVGQTLCGPLWCTAEGSWHLAWQIPYYLWPLPGDLFLYYAAAVFILPLFYGAWRGVLFALIGPALAYATTSDPTEWPAVWCLFSVALILLALASEKIRKRIFPHMR